MLFYTWKYDTQEQLATTSVGLILLYSLTHGGNGYNLLCCRRMGDISWSFAYTFHAWIMFVILNEMQSVSLCRLFRVSFSLPSTR